MGPDLSIAKVFPLSMFKLSLMQSTWTKKMEAGCCLLGDGGYACTTTSYMMTPLRNPVSDAEWNCNLAHAQIRGVTERLFGLQFLFDVSSLWKYPFLLLISFSSTIPLFVLNLVLLMTGH